MDDENTINNLLMEAEKQAQRINVLLDCLVTAKAGVAGAKESFVCYTTATETESVVGLIHVLVPDIYIGRKFRIVLEPEE